MRKHVLNSAPRTEPLITIYPNYFSLNAAAMQLLDMRGEGAVSVMEDDRDGYIYIASNPDAKVSYRVSGVGCRGVVSNAKLCKRLAEMMEGTGRYRICSEESVEFMGHVYYNIFAKKYGKD